MGKASEWLGSLKIGEPQAAGQIFTVFPLTVSETNGRDYLTLEEAFRQGLVFIPESRSVQEAVIVVKGEKPVLIMEGEVIVGGWQNRTINISLLLEAGKKHHIPVSCIERGRWSPRRVHRPSVPTVDEEVERVAFRVAEYAVHSRLRRKKTESATMQFLITNRPISDQREVWREVSEELMAAKVRSETEDATAFYEHHRASIDDLLKPIVTVENQVGVIVGIGRSIVGLEVFDHPETWRILGSKVLYGYAAEALESLWMRRFSGLVSHDEAKAFRDMVVAVLGRATVKPAPVGMGEHYLFDGTVNGFALVHGNKVRHLFAFPESRRW